MQSLVIFASGAGSNAAAIIEYFKKSTTVRVALIVTNKPEAGVVQVAAAHNIPVCHINRTSWQQPDFMADLQAYQPSLLVLAGFLWQLPPALVQAFPEAIINIHPALLPLFGGKGMYGTHVHEAVLQAGHTTSGITIHYVNEEYDKGDTIVQAHCPVLPGDTAGSLATRIHALEHYFFPRTIEYLLQQKAV